MSRRRNGKGKGAESEFPRDPNGWYVETRAAVNQLADAIAFSSEGLPDLIWDPSCGGGMIPDVMSERGHPAIGSDIVERGRWGRNPWTFYRGNFLAVTRWPTPHDGRRLSIICNPPYNEPEPGIAEAFIHRALEMIPFHRAAFLVPIGFLAGQTRYDRLWSPHRPSHVGICCERPSMPPGELLARLGEDCRGGGMEDFVWIVWTDGGPWRTETLFLRPTALAPLPSSGRVRRLDRTDPTHGSQPRRNRHAS